MTFGRRAAGVSASGAGAQTPRQISTGATRPQELSIPPCVSAHALGVIGTIHFDREAHGRCTCTEVRDESYTILASNHAEPRGSSPHLGSTDTISDSTGASFTQHFDPFGAPVAPPNPEITRVGFTGQDQDVDLGFTDMKGRMYDPLAGRFASADPIMQAPFWSQGLNRYSYAFNDPINNTDPSGFESTAVWLYGAAFAVGDVALLCAGSGACGGLGGVLDLGINLGTTGLNGFPGAARPGMSFSGPVPTAAPAASGVGQGTTYAIGQNRGGILEGASLLTLQAARQSRLGKDDRKSRI